MPEVRTVFREAPFAMADAEAEVLRRQGLLREPPDTQAAPVPFAVPWGSPEAVSEQALAAAQDEAAPEPEQPAAAGEPASARRKARPAGKTTKESA